MRVVLQRVARASVEVSGQGVASIGPGVLLLVAIAPHDDDDAIAWMADKTVNLRVFADDEGRMNRSLSDVAGAALVVSQFTLYGDVRKGRRPSWAGAAAPEVAVERVEAFAQALEERGATVARGVFGADMQVELLNEGPVTLILDSDRR